MRSIHSLTPKVNKSVLLVSQHLWGTGHLTRTAAIASAVADTLGYSVTHISGGPSVSSFVPSNSVDFIQLPSVQPAGKFSTEKQVSGEHGLSLREVLQKRFAIVKSVLAKKHFDAVITEFYPFAPERMADIAEPIISQLTQNPNSPTRFICSIRDIPFNGKRKQYPKDELKILHERLLSFYDAVWHHTDPRIVDISMIPELAETLQDVNIKTTGYILSSSPKHSIPNEEDATKILITVGGGRDGYEVIASVLKELVAYLPPQVTEAQVVCGPFMPNEDISDLRSIAKGQRKIHIYKQVRNLRRLIDHCSVVISMAGYNTVVEATAMRRPLLLIPRVDIFEQESRAAAFAKAGLALVHWPSQPDSNLANAIQELLTFQPQGTLDTNGTARCSEFLSEMLENKRRRS